jgi:DNA repair protein RadD
MQLREYQTDAIAGLWATFRANPKARPLIVCPTGSGKSILAAEIVRQVLEKRPHFKVLIVTHRKEIVEQNARKFQELTKMPIGVMSAGLGQKTIRQVTFANIQSIYRSLVTWDLIIVDEAHLISGKPESMYAKLFSNQRNCRIIGLTATPYRMDHGFLIGEGTLFSEVAYEIKIEHLIAQEFLSPLISVPQSAQINTKNISLRGFDYNLEQLEAEAMLQIEEHCEEIKRITKDRKHVLIFCSGVNHALRIATEIGGECVHGGLLTFERDRIVNRFKDGTNKYLTNCDILTTGFDFPDIDCVVLLRATQSVGLYVQMVGRGLRIAPDKKNCLVADFGGNIKRHGPIDCIEVSYKNPLAPEFSLQPLKSCDECGCVVPIRIMECPGCNAPFPVESKYTAQADVAPVTTAVAPSFRLEHVQFFVHHKIGKPPSFRVDYFLEGDERISDYLCFEHGGFAAQMAVQKWLALGGSLPAPETADEALERKYELKRPLRIQTKKEGKYYRVTKILEWFEKEEEDNLELPNI